MYEVMVVNQSPYDLTTFDGKTIKPDDQWHSPATTGWIDTGFCGRLAFLDIGTQRIPGDSEEKYGALILYRDESFVGRYADEGAITIGFDPFLQAALSGSMDIRQVMLDAITTASG